MFLLYHLLTHSLTPNTHPTYEQVRPADMHTERENKLFVGMLPMTVDDAMLESLFAPYGKIKEVHIIRTPEVRREGGR